MLQQTVVVREKEYTKDVVNYVDEAGNQYLHKH